MVKTGDRFNKMLPMVLFHLYRANYDQNKTTDK